MKAAQTLRRPANWQDFESLCCKLWGEIWNCPEIQQNGRLGQDQSGVDIFGIPSGEVAYYGIQCKGKSEYNDDRQQFTEQEIDKIIDDAKKFEPPLKKLYLATTAQSDSKVQTYVRKKNLEQRERTSFEVHLYSWEAIVNLIDENQDTLNWYLLGKNYKTQFEVNISLNGSQKETFYPKFKKVTTRYERKRTAIGFPEAIPQNEGIVVNPVGSFFDGSENLSYCKFNFLIHNTGTAPLEDAKLLFRLEEKVGDLSWTNLEYPAINLKLRHNVFFDDDNQGGEVVPQDVLVGDEVFFSNDIFLKPLPEEYSIPVKWKLISRNYKQEGSLVINIIPQFENASKTIISNSPENGTKQESIEDFISQNSDTSKNVS